MTYFCTFFQKYHRKTSFKFRKLKFLLSLVVFIKISQKWHFLSKNCSYIWSFFIKISQKWHFLSKNCSFIWSFYIKISQKWHFLSKNCRYSGNFINFKKILTFIHKNDIFCQKITDIKVVLSILWNFIFFQICHSLNFFLWKFCHFFQKVYCLFSYRSEVGARATEGSEPASSRESSLLLVWRKQIGK